MSEPGDQYLPLLRETGCDERVIAHCITVRNLSLEIADQILTAGTAVPDRDLIGRGAMIHDIGRSVTHGMDHADAGVAICREQGFDEAVCRIIQRHIGAGLTARERGEMGLVPVDTLPETLEEKIVAHADNMVKGDRVLTADEFHVSIRKFPPETQNRFLNLKAEITRLQGSDIRGSGDEPVEAP